MRLLDTESLETAIMQSGITINLDVHDFYGAVWKLIKTAEITDDDAAMAALEKDMRRLFRDYYSQTESFLIDQELETADQDTLPEWRAASLKGRDLLRGFEKQLQRYAICYMHLSRALAQSRKEVEQIARLYPREEHKQKLRITDVTGMLVARAFRQKKQMLERRERLIALRNVLENLQNRFALLREDLYGVLPGPNVERAYIAFRAELRQGNFAGARAMVDQWTSMQHMLGGSRYKIVRNNAGTIVDLLEKNEGLRVQNSYALEQSEIGLLFSFLDADENRVDTFLRKYMLPFLVFKLRTLLTMAYRLGRIGSLEGLFVLHARLVGGIANPMGDIAQVKRYEEDVAGRAAFLMKNGFPDLSHIFNESEVTFDHIRALFRETHDVGGHIQQAPAKL